MTYKDEKIQQDENLEKEDEKLVELKRKEDCADINREEAKTGESPDTLENTLKQAKRNFSVLGLGAFTILAVAALLQIILGEAMDYFYPNGNEPLWVLWTFSFVPMYLVAVPCGLYVFTKVPAAPLKKHNLTVGRYISAFFICVILLYLGNIIGILILELLESVFNLAAINPLDSFILDSPIWIQILVVVIIGPLIEEYIFRKQLIDRMNIYGERTAILTSALLFGLFHGNLTQFFYAFFVGLVFGYIYVKTGQLKYSASLHMIINLIGGVLPGLLIERINFALLDRIEMGDLTVLNQVISQMVPFLIFIILMFISGLVGLILFFINIRKISFDPLKPELPKGKRIKTVYFNTGMILLLAATVISIIQSFDF